MKMNVKRNTTMFLDATKTQHLVNTGKMVLALSHVVQEQLGSNTYIYTVIFEDNPRRLDVVGLTGLFHYGLCFLNSTLGK